MSHLFGLLNVDGADIPLDGRVSKNVRYTPDAKELKRAPQAPLRGPTEKGKDEHAGISLIGRRCRIWRPDGCA
jgi:hypothetical protein